MRKILLVVLTLFMAFANNALADRIVERRSAGSISIVVDADAPEVLVSQASRYSVQPHEWDVPTSLQAFWPDCDLGVIIGTVERGEVEIEWEGKPIYTEDYTYQGDNISLRINEGYFDFLSSRYNAWAMKYDERLEASKPKNEDSTWTSMDISEWYAYEKGEVISEIATVEEMTRNVRRLLQSLGLEVEIRLVDQGSQTERIGEETYSINTIDFAVEKESIPCDNRSYLTALSSTDREIPAQYISAAFDQSGLCRFDCRIFDVISSEAAFPLLNYNSALDSMADMYSLVLASDSIEIRSISLCYVMTPIPGKCSALLMNLLGV